jgi:hypothetical protein
MDKETEALSDKYLRDAGYDPDLVRGRKSKADIEREDDERRRAQWRIKNSLRDTDKRQVGLMPPRPAEPEKRRSSFTSFVLGFIAGKIL